MIDIPRFKILFLALVTFFYCFSQSAIKTEIKLKNGKWEIYRGGNPYYIKGAGGTVHMNWVVGCGGNSVRTWGAENAGEILDQAQKNGLSVMLGLWVQHERHGFDYDNANKVQKQWNDFREIVLKYKDHPALLLWGVGNEVDLNYSNTKVWDAINDIAKMIHELDPNHPTSTVTAGLDSMEVVLIKEKAPHIDIYGINTYGDIGNVKNNIKKFGWKGPYMITEWGPTGHWESPTTDWGFSLESSSTEKSEVYTQRYKNFIEADSNTCIGSYVFLWGQKQEYTNSWYGIFTSKGEPTETLDAIHYCWKGKHPEKKTPSVDAFQLNGKLSSENVILKSGKEYFAEIKVDPKGSDKLKYFWSVRPESSDLKSGGDFENEPDEINGVVKKRNDNKVRIKTPSEEGAYRLYFKVKGNGKVAYANFPFYVEKSGPSKQWIRFKNQNLESFNTEN